MAQSSDITIRIKKKAESMVNKKKRSLSKIRTMGLENYLKAKIEKYADSPSMHAHFQNELRMLTEAAN